MAGKLSNLYSKDIANNAISFYYGSVFLKKGCVYAQTQFV